MSTLRECNRTPSQLIPRLEEVAKEYAYTGSLSKHLRLTAREPSRSEKNRVYYAAYAKVVAHKSAEKEIIKLALRVGCKESHIVSYYDSASSVKIIFTDAVFFSFDGKHETIRELPEFKEWLDYYNLVKQYKELVLCGADDLNLITQIK